MKYLKLFEELNLKNLYWYIRKIIQDLKEVIEFNEEDSVNRFKKYLNGINKSYKDFYTIDFHSEPLEDLKKEKIVNNILNKWKSKLFRQNIILAFKIYHNDYQKKEEKILSYRLSIHIVLKEIYKGIVKPPKFVYHTSSSENRNSILENGLIPKKHSESQRWGNTIGLEYPAAIFATTDGYWNKGDIWKIDTSKIKNIWYKDLNIQTSNVIMTFESIPPNALELIFI